MLLDPLPSVWNQRLSPLFRLLFRQGPIASPLGCLPLRFVDFAEVQFPLVLLIFMSGRGVVLFRMSLIDDNERGDDRHFAVF